jgi:Leucine Rich repeat
LDLSYNGIGDEGCRSLAASLQHVPRLTSLDVSNNTIGRDSRLTLTPFNYRIKHLSL